MRPPVEIGEPAQAKGGDLLEGILAEGSVGHHLEPADERGGKHAMQRGEHLALDPRVDLRAARRADLLHQPVADVARQDDDGVGEVGLDPLRILHPAAVEHLVQHLDDVAVGLLDFVEQHHAAGGLPDPFGEHPALAVSHVPARGRP